MKIMKFVVLFISILFLASCSTTTENSLIEIPKVKGSVKEQKL